MFGHVVRTTVIAAVAAGAVAGAPGAASAAAKACAVGKWTMVKHSFSAKGEGYDFTGTGGKGVRLTVGKKSLSWDFRGSKRLVSQGTRSGEKVAMWSRYDGRLRVPASFKGNKKGLLTADVRKAKGDATARTGKVGAKRPDATYPLAPNYRKGKPETIALGSGSFTCTGRSLHLVLATKSATDSSRFDTWFRRG
ncbi:hypothetical protein [Actinocorallia sp. A-T 12471]|uniref:hypothetical protein n=1 Tax=Actinocorallia sp. A-T 12471 TaxID=3089813 RepID=UPI0029D190CD|nr:hypothetical protein [Actinocorallia sp. A-T 12471]MDX6738335.1 hypothetical protein [Actinocorallia sp. A-T 12471]